jgi:SAM-dependent methyltransferase
VSTDLSSYSRTHRHFLSEMLPPLLLDAAAAHPGGVVADLGSGDGAILWALERRGLLGETAYAIDLSPERVAAAEQVSPKVRGIVADATQVTGLEDSSVDGVIASQLIEHIPDDRLLAREIARVLKPGGWWYVGTVLRGPRAWWFYKVDGVRRLDPTHVREYESPGELVDALDDPGLELEQVRVTPVSYPLTDLAARAAAVARVIKFERLSNLYLESPRLERARRLRVRAPGYKLLEACGIRRTNAAS